MCVCVSASGTICQFQFFIICFFRNILSSFHYVTSSCHQFILNLRFLSPTLESFNFQQIFLKKISFNFFFRFYITYFLNPIWLLKFNLMLTSSATDIWRSVLLTYCRSFYISVQKNLVYCFVLVSSVFLREESTGEEIRQISTLC